MVNTYVTLKIRNLLMLVNWLTGLPVNQLEEAHYERNYHSK